MAGLESTLAAIATGLKTITGLRVHDDGLWPDTVNPPAACIKPRSNDPLSMDESSVTERIEVVVVVKGGGQYESAQKALLPYCANTGASSIKAALMTALGGALISANRREYGQFEMGSVILAGAAWDLEVICE